MAAAEKLWKHTPFAIVAAHALLLAACASQDSADQGAPTVDGGVKTADGGDSGSAGDDAGIGPTGDAGSGGATTDGSQGDTDARPDGEVEGGSPTKFDGRAFPGAEGAGAASVGGRGGAVIEVTNLGDSGTGSLRACFEASGPRTCVFRVSGFIQNNSRLEVSNPYLTVAGQTAPGGGIVVGAGQTGGGESVFISTHDVVMRYLTYDGNSPVTPGPSTGTVGFELASGDVHDVILDHISARWWSNKAFPALSNDSGNVHDDTFQWILEYEPNAGHPVGIEQDATDGSALLSVNQDWHHSMFVNVDHRVPLIDVRSVRWVNNIVYNWNQFAALTWGAAQMDYIGNEYVDGNLSQDTVHVFLSNGNSDDPNDQADNCVGSDPCDNNGHPGLYLLNNIGRSTPTPGSAPLVPTTTPNDSGQISLTHQGWEGGETGDSNSTGSVPSSWFRSKPLAAETYPITAVASTDLDGQLLATVGNSQHLDCLGHWVSNRDSQDTRVVAEYMARGPGAQFSGQFSAPSIPAGVPCTESLHDGIPDAWKTANGLDATDMGLAAKTAPNGYTYLEDYLSGLVPTK